MEGRTTSEREEWRGDLFRSDLARILPHLPSSAEIARPFQHTVTIFYAEEGHWVEDRKPLRIRAYANLPDLSPHTIAAFLSHRISGKLQAKGSVDVGLCDEVHAEALGNVEGEDFPELPHQVEVDGREYTPHSVRIARRCHYSVAALLAADTKDTEHHRVTLDLERHLFRLAGTEEPAYLGDLGPRLEIKAPTADEIEQVQRVLAVSDLAAHLPYRSLELLFQDLLLSALSVARTSSFPEIEGKLLVTGDDIDAHEVGTRLVEWVESLDRARLLLPLPNRIVRLRRYHVADADGDEREWTVVETMSGGLSPKIKRGARTDKRALIRDTEASHATDRMGAHASVEQFVDENGLRLLNRFDKLQIQVPFALDNDHAYLVKVDDCVDPEGHRLVEIELETIGSLSGESLDADEIVADTDRLVGELLESPLGDRIESTTRSKHEFFSHCCAPAAA